MWVYGYPAVPMLFEFAGLNNKIQPFAPPGPQSFLLLLSPHAGNSDRLSLPYRLP